MRAVSRSSAACSRSKRTRIRSRRCFAQAKRSDPAAARECREIFLPLSVGAKLADNDLREAGHGDTDGICRRAARELFDESDVGGVTETRPAVIFGEGDCSEPELSQLND